MNTFPMFIQVPYLEFFLQPEVLPVDPFEFVRPEVVGLRVEADEVHGAHVKRIIHALRLQVPGHAKSFPILKKITEKK